MERKQKIYLKGWYDITIQPFLIMFSNDILDLSLKIYRLTVEKYLDSFYESHKVKYK